MKDEKLSLEYICTHLGEEDAAHKYEGAVNAPLFATSLHVFENIEGLLEGNLVRETSQSKKVELSCFKIL